MIGSLIAAWGLLSACSGGGTAATTQTGGSAGQGSGGSAGSGVGTAAGGGAVRDASPPVAPGTWINLYYPGWTQSALPMTEIDLAAVTQIIHFALVPTVAEGGPGVTLNDTLNSVDAASTRIVVDAAHGAGTKVLMCVGGSGRGSRDFAAAIADPAFIPLLISTAVDRGYDGIDIDIETRNVTPASFLDFSRQLREQVTATAPNLILSTAALGAASATYGPAAAFYDEINVMTYNFVYGPTQTWHDSPVSGGGGQFYSIDRAAREFEAAGVPRSKIGIGLTFSGFVFMGATAPQQPFTGRPSSVSYNTIMLDYYSAAAYHWDDRAQAPYLGVTTPATAFVTYEDESSIRAKFDFLRSGPYGGIILWDASGGVLAPSVSSERMPLMQAIKQAAAGMVP
jgi:chitinase